MEKVETPFCTLLFYCCVFLLTRSLITALSNLSAGFIAIGHSSGLVTIMDILTGSILSRAEAHSGKVTSVQVSSHNNFIATTAEDGTCRVWIVGANLARGGGGEDEEGGGLKLCSQVAFRGRIVGCLMLPPRSSVGLSTEVSKGELRK